MREKTNGRREMASGLLLISPNCVVCVSAWGFDVSSCLRQCGLVSVVLTAWCLLGGAVRAGYVPVAANGGDEAGHSLSSSALLPAERDAGTSMASSSGSTCELPDANDPHAPANPRSPFATLPNPLCNFGPGSGAGSSSSFGSGNGPSNSPAGVVLRPQVPPLELASLLPPETGDVHPFSVASFLFRPPRAA